MSAGMNGVVHINLLERRTLTLTMGTMLGLVLALTVGGLVLYGRSVVPVALAASQRSDALVLQINEAKTKLAQATGEKTRNARSVALRQEIDGLQPQAQAAQGLVAAVRGAEGGRADDISRALDLATSISEPGLWLTSLSLGQGGKRVELQGQAGGGAAVLRFAKRTNESLAPLSLRLDSLEMTPSTGANAAAGGAAPAVAQGVSFKLF